LSQVIAICQSKGGVGKTTMAINLGAALAQCTPPQKVLLVDLDPQGHLTEGVGLQELYLRDTPTLYQCLLGEKGVRFSDLIFPHDEEQFSVVPSGYEMMLAEQSLYMARNREHKLRMLIQEVASEFDWILFDCPPALGNLTDNALNAARQAIVPVQAEATSVRALELLFEQIESIEQGLGIQIKILAVVPNLVQESTLSKQILEQLRESIPVVTPFEFKKRVLLQNAWNVGCSIFALHPDRHDQLKVREEIVVNYQQLAKLVLEQTGAVHD
jgi:chromosome partitioning protein